MDNQHYAPLTTSWSPSIYQIASGRPSSLRLYSWPSLEASLHWGETSSPAGPRCSGETPPQVLAERQPSLRAEAPGPFLVAVGRDGAS